MLKMPVTNFGKGSPNEEELSLQKDQGVLADEMYKVSNKVNVDISIVNQTKR